MNRLFPQRFCAKMRLQSARCQWRLKIPDISDRECEFAGPVSVNHE